MKGIYKITSPSGRIYIGQSNNLDKRRRHYTPGRCKNQKLINNSLRKYGYKNHIFEVIHELPEDVNQDILDVYEKIYHDQYKELGFKMLNLKECGKGGGKHSEETKRIIGLQSKERFKSINDFEIYQFDQNGKLIDVFTSSILDISKTKGFQAPSITRSLNRNSIGEFKMAHNSFWFYRKDLKKVHNIDLKRVILKTNQYGKFYMYW